jgi:NAD(P)-dependent dehydrogenase (short-subunit alcohol dehydrogenase family)
VAIAPGLFATPMLHACPRIAATVSPGAFRSRTGSASRGDYAALVLDLCRNVMINGEVIRLDGALRMAAR